MTIFQTPGPVRLTVEIQAGRIEVTAADIQETHVELRPVDAEAQALIDRAEVRQDGDRIYVLLPREPGGGFFWGFRKGVEAIIRVPTSSIARLATGSGAIETRGGLGDVAARTGSGRVEIEQGKAVDVRTGSGAVRIQTAGGYVEVKSGSGQIEVGDAGQDARITTGSGSISVGRVGGKLKAASGSGSVEIGETGEAVEAVSASGRVRVRRASGGRVRAHSTSGRVSIGVAQGVAAWLDINTVSGRVDSNLDASEAPGDGEARVELKIQTVSGGVDINRAEAAAHV